MRSNVISVTDKVLQRCQQEEARSYLEAFKLDCQVRNLSQKTIDVYFERLGYVLGDLTRQEVPFRSITVIAGVKVYRVAVEKCTTQAPS